MLRELDAFTKTAAEFCQWCGTTPKDGATEARFAASILARLYTLAHALELPDDVEPDIQGMRPDDAAWKAVATRAEALPFDAYWMFDAPQDLDSDESVIGSLSDDLADIYRDLATGLSLLDQGHRHDAQWEFVHSFRTHWGSHAASAIHALHQWLTETGEW